MPAAVAALARRGRAGSSASAGPPPGSDWPRADSFTETSLPGGQPGGCEPVEQRAVGVTVWLGLRGRR